MQVVDRANEVVDRWHLDHIWFAFGRFSIKHTNFRSLQFTNPILKSAHEHISQKKHNWLQIMDSKRARAHSPWHGNTIGGLATFKSADSSNRPSRSPTTRSKCGAIWVLQALMHSLFTWTYLGHITCKYDDHGTCQHHGQYMHVPRPYCMRIEWP